jgi:hypothetical protein
MKKIIFITFLLVFASKGIFAQTAGKGTPIEGYKATSPADRAKAATDKLNQTVQLSAEQYDKVLQINKDFFAQAQPGNLPAAKLATDRDNKVKALLSAGQVQKLNAAKAN